MNYLALIFLIQSASCNNNMPRYAKKLDSVSPVDSVKSGPADTTYMRTGFYYLAPSQDGVKMREENTNNFFSIARTPFASVDNISSAKVQKEDYNGKTITSLCLTFDAKGTRDLQDGTGDPAHPKLALVIANKLLYVVDNSAKISKGVMNIMLDDYSEKDIQSMEKAIHENK
ncbi:hypothetical protein Q4E93_19275 [Flavitalea sp. BT771]|uniref:hypothetical protein n=1 Tax=Flavitalea sp. BT771 TaxID=3063329 RepID=UPI0026E295E1|nr:hypothetical protein [Flavitalea sp. BT771]MDO6432757.1 hypothetical protein [Flavitalea sp. BT771]MDV6221967.1 hypothetical protein [Flavitalea sp. BT771]